jgi:hypothetical protein
MVGGIRKIGAGNTILVTAVSFRAWLRTIVDIRMKNLEN